MSPGKEAEELYQEAWVSWSWWPATEQRGLEERDLTVSLDRMGDLRMSQGKKEAEELYREGLGIMRELVDSDRSNAGWKRDLTVSLNRMGDLRMKNCTGGPGYHGAGG